MPETPDPGVAPFLADQGMNPADRTQVDTCVMAVQQQWPHLTEAQADELVNHHARVVFALSDLFEASPNLRAAIEAKLAEEG
jgi:hypothetical protein